MSRRRKAARLVAFWIGSEIRRLGVPLHHASRNSAKPKNDTSAPLLHRSNQMAQIRDTQIVATHHGKNASFCALMKPKKVSC
jgi:hypothetical protein